MPTYQYRCTVCEHEFEETRKMSDRHFKPDEPCPKCGTPDNILIVINAAPKIVTGVGSVHSKTDSGFRDNLKEMKNRYRNSTIRV